MVSLTVAAVTGGNSNRHRCHACFLGRLPPMVGSLFSWKSLFTNRSTSEDYGQQIVKLALTTFGYPCTAWEPEPESRHHAKWRVTTTYLSYSGLPQKYQFDATAWLRGICG